jgi:hypothetical protein
MLVPITEITITAEDGSRKWQFDAVANGLIVEDTATLTDTCMIELPKKTVWQGATPSETEPVGLGEKPLIKRGDKILVRLGFDGELKERFSGYIRSVGTKNPMKIECEDGMFLLKLAPLKKEGFKSITLDKLMEKLLASTNIKYKLIDKDIQLGSYRITQPTVASELNELKKELGLMAFFRNYDGEQYLYVGLTYPFDSVTKHGFFYGNNLIEESFEYKRKEDLKVKVKAVSTSKDNKKIEIEVGDKDGEQVDVKIFGLDKKALQKFAEDTLANAKYEGLRGSFKTLGEPLINKTDKAYIETEDGNKGTYLAKKVEVLFGFGGFFQNVELGQIINNG